jgi:hypothetical protein
LIAIGDRLTRVIGESVGAALAALPITTLKSTINNQSIITKQ